MQYARTYCERLYHRGGDCKGPNRCDGPNTLIAEDIVRRVKGSDGGRRPFDGLWIKGHEKHGDVDIYAFLGASMHDDDALRAWCGERGLPQRGDRHPPRMREDVTALYLQAMRNRPGLRIPLLDAGSPVATTVRWLDGMWRDAVQTGTSELFDATRIARWLIRTDQGAVVEEPVVAEIGRRTWILDDIVAATWPGWYDKFLGRGRQLTNVGVAI
jgi:hypothetical protein